MLRWLNRKFDRQSLRLCLGARQQLLDAGYEDSEVELWRYELPGLFGWWRDSYWVCLFRMSHTHTGCYFGHGGGGCLPIPIWQRTADGTSNALLAAIRKHKPTGTNNFRMATRLELMEEPMAPHDDCFLFAGRRAKSRGWDIAGAVVVSPTGERTDHAFCVANYWLPYPTDTPHILIIDVDGWAVTVRRTERLESMLDAYLHKTNRRGYRTEAARYIYRQSSERVRHRPTDGEVMP